jgi:hypothetical protein
MSGSDELQRVVIPSHLLYIYGDITSPLCLVHYCWLSQNAQLRREASGLRNYSKKSLFQTRFTFQRYLKDCRISNRVFAT